MIIFADFSDQGLDRIGIGNAFPGIGVENRPARVLRLDVILQIEGFENIVGKIYLELGRVRIKRLGFDFLIILLICADNVRIFLLVALGKTVGGPFRRRGFEIVIIPRLLLKQDQAVAHEIQDLLSKFLPFRCGDVPPQEIEASLIHPNEPDRGKMVFPVFVEALLDAPQIVSRVGIEIPIGEFLQYLSLDFEALLGGHHQFFETIP